MSWVSRLAILKIKGTKLEIRTWLSLIYTAFRLVLPSHFNIGNFFNDHILFQEYTTYKFFCLLYIGQSSFTFLLQVLVILKIKGTKLEIRTWLSLIYTAFRLVLPSHFNIGNFFNDYILFQEYTSFKFFCLLYIGQSSFTFLLQVCLKFGKKRTN